MTSMRFSFVFVRLWSHFYLSLMERLTDMNRPPSRAVVRPRATEIFKIKFGVTSTTALFAQDNRQVTSYKLLK